MACWGFDYGHMVSSAITFYSISGKFDQILEKIALNTYNKYILKLIIKKTCLWENAGIVTGIVTHVVSFNNNNKDTGE